MNKLSLGIASLIALTGVAQAALVVQEFQTAQIKAGINSFSTFNVNQFNTGGGMWTLERVTVSISLDSWNGYYNVINTTDPSGPVIVTIQQGSAAWITGAPIPGALSTTTLFAGLTKPNVTLNEAGDKDGIVGPTYANRYNNMATADAAKGDFGSYQGSGTYAINFHSAQASTHESEGAIDGSFAASTSQGFMTVTYEYTPEPTSLALLAIGCAVVGMRRRGRNTQKA